MSRHYHMGNAVVKRMSAPITFIDVYQDGNVLDNDRMSKDVYEIRRTNMRALAKEKGGISALAAFLGKSQGRVSHLIGETPIKNIGSRTAREVEEKFCKPYGWMDHDHDQLVETAETKPEPQAESVEVKELAARFAKLSQDKQEALWILLGEIPGTPKRLHIGYGRRGTTGPVIGSKKPKKGKKNADDTP